MPRTPFEQLRSTPLGNLRDLVATPEQQQFNQEAERLGMTPEQYLEEKMSPRAAPVQPVGPPEPVSPVPVAAEQYLADLVGGAARTVGDYPGELREGVRGFAQDIGVPSDPLFAERPELALQAIDDRAYRRKVSQETEIAAKTALGQTRGLFPAPHEQWRDRNEIYGDLDDKRIAEKQRELGMSEESITEHRIRRNMFAEELQVSGNSPWAYVSAISSIFSGDLVAQHGFTLAKRHIKDIQEQARQSAQERGEVYTGDEFIEEPLVGYLKGMLTPQQQRALDAFGLNIEDLLFETDRWKASGGLSTQPNLKPIEFGELQNVGRIIEQYTENVGPAQQGEFVSRMLKFAEAQRKAPTTPLSENALNDVARAYLEAPEGVKTATTPAVNPWWDRRKAPPLRYVGHLYMRYRGYNDRKQLESDPEAMRVINLYRSNAPESEKRKAGIEAIQTLLMGPVNPSYFERLEHTNGVARVLGSHRTVKASEWAGMGWPITNSIGVPYLPLPDEIVDAANKIDGHHEAISYKSYMMLQTPVDRMRYAAREAEMWRAYVEQNIPPAVFGTRAYLRAREHLSGTEGALGDLDLFPVYENLDEYVRQVRRNPDMVAAVDVKAQEDMANHLFMLAHAEQLIPRLSKTIKALDDGSILDVSRNWFSDAATVVFAPVSLLLGLGEDLVNLGLAGAGVVAGVTTEAAEAVGLIEDNDAVWSWTGRRGYDATTTVRGLAAYGEHLLSYFGPDGGRVLRQNMKQHPLQTTADLLMFTRASRKVLMKTTAFSWTPSLYRKWNTWWSRDGAVDTIFTTSADDAMRSRAEVVPPKRIGADRPGGVSRAEPVKGPPGPIDPNLDLVWNAEKGKWVPYKEWTGEIKFTGKGADDIPPPAPPSKPPPPTPPTVSFTVPAGKPPMRAEDMGGSYQDPAWHRRTNTKTTDQASADDIRAWYEAAEEAQASSPLVAYSQNARDIGLNAAKRSDGISRFFRGFLTEDKVVGQAMAHVVDAENEQLKHLAIVNERALKEAIRGAVDAGFTETAVMDYLTEVNRMLVQRQYFDEDPPAMYMRVSKPDAPEGYIDVLDSDLALAADYFSKDMASIVGDVIAGRYVAGTHAYSIKDRRGVEWDLDLEDLGFVMTDPFGGILPGPVLSDLLQQRLDEVSDQANMEGLVNLRGLDKEQLGARFDHWSNSDFIDTVHNMEHLWAHADGPIIVYTETLWNVQRPADAYRPRTEVEMTRGRTQEQIDAMEKQGLGGVHVPLYQTKAWYSPKVQDVKNFVSRIGLEPIFATSDQTLAKVAKRYFVGKALEDPSGRLLESPAEDRYILREQRVFSEQVVEGGRGGGFREEVG